MSFLTKIDLKVLDWWSRLGTKQPAGPTGVGRHRANGLSTMQKMMIRHEAIRNVQAGKVVLG